MALPFNLDKLPPEMLDVVRYLGAQRGAVRVGAIADGMSSSERVVMRAIRRLVNYNLISMADDGSYQVTSEGRRGYQALLEADGAPKPITVEREKQKVNRRLTAVIPAALPMGKPGVLYIGIDPPNGAQLPTPVTVDLRITALGAAASTTMTSVSVPPAAAAQPIRLMLTPTVTDKPVRLIIDAYQAFQVAELTPAGNMFVDIPVSAVPSASRRAVAVDLTLVED